MTENTDATKSLIPPERHIKLLAELLESVPPQYRQEFGSGHLIIGDGLEIKGEGEERKLHIIINPDDPEYQQYQKDYLKIVNEEKEIAEKKIKDEETSSNNKATDMLLEKEAELIVAKLDPDIHPEVKKALDDFERGLKSINKDHNSFVKKLSENEALDLINMRKKHLIELLGHDKLYKRTLLVRLQELNDVIGSTDDLARAKQAREDFEKNAALLRFCIQLGGKTVYTLAEPKQEDK